MVGRVEDGPSQGPQQSTLQEVPISKTPRPMPFVPGTLGKRPNQNTLAEFQELPEITPSSTPLPPDIMTTIRPKINPT